MSLRSVGLLIISIVASILAARAADAAGQRTHVEIGRRALDRYCDDIESMLPGFKEIFADPEARSAYYSGCMFPDWGYGNINNQAAEDAHWRRFQEVYFKYLQEKCPRPWDASERRRIAFFLGIICHGMGDLPWHFSKEGHESLLAKTWGHDRASHSETEAAYDIFLYRDGDPPGDLIPQHWWPMEDIKEVYRRFGTILPDGQLEQSLQRAHAMFNGGPVASRFTASSLQSRLPWVHKNVDGYYFGGVDNGGALTASWLKYFYARFVGSRFYQSLPTAVAEDNDDRVYQGCLDTTVRSAAPNYNSGNEPMLDLAGNGVGDSRATLIRFDVSDCNAGESIAKAELWLYQVDTDPAIDGDKEIGAYTCSFDWNEGVGATNDVTGWEGQPDSDGGATWRHYADSLSSTPDAPLDVLRVSSAAGDNRWLKWDVTAAARAWIADPSRNHGLILRPTPASANKPGIVRVYSSEAFRASQDGNGGGHRIALRPILVITPN